MQDLVVFINKLMFMKRKSTAIMTVALITLLFCSCKKNQGDCAWLRADVLRYDCDRVILKIHSPVLVGDAEWTDASTGRTYTNVISYDSPCKIVELTQCVKKTVYVMLYDRNAEPSANDCPVQCQAMSQFPPETSYQLSAVLENPCKQQS